MFNLRSNAVKDHMLKLHRSPDFLVIKVATGTLRLVDVTDKLINNLKKKKKESDWTFFFHLWVIKVVILAVDKDLLLYIVPSFSDVSVNLMDP